MPPLGDSQRNQDLKKMLHQRLKALSTSSSALLVMPCLCFHCQQLRCVLCLQQVNYFPSRFDPVCHAEKVPYNNTYISGQREKRIIEKENNFK